MLNQIAIKTIRLYQQHISPRKGYCCAHHVLHQNGSCSSWAIAAIESHGTLAMVSQFGARLAECNEASKELSAKKSENKEEAPPCDKACTATDAGCCILASWPFT
ncbi:MAG: membrane protein insertion efficiency factor YidD [Chromatiaceae bacterium]|nr:membrane protein insertion efficiency factor YidD [Chromatiaceae bacterium]MCP5421727.1 membrane protein insertion efficiency factor YidD [Chromatiaceae bacterium]